MAHRIHCIVGARPNFMKLAPVRRALLAAGVEPLVVHTGQHYDVELNARIFAELGIPDPDVNLEVGSASHAVQTAEIMRRFEPLLTGPDGPPGAVLVVGDVNSTIATALVAAKLHVPVVHVEAGLRSYDRRMPEEVNRVLTDQLADLLFTTERSARANLEREGVDPARVHFVGNVMIDTLVANLDRAVPPEETVSTHGAPAGFLAGDAGPALLTLHRPSNVDDRATLRGLLQAVAELSGETPVVFPVHPRTRGRIDELGLAPVLDVPGVLQTPPLGYHALLGLMRQARYVLTDSGGIQEETTALGVPCFTLRESTERPVTIDEGTNTLVGPDPDRLRREVAELLRTGGKRGDKPELWDGKASERIAALLVAWLDERGQAMV